MPQARVEIEIVGAPKAASEIERFASSGIHGFERMQQRAIDLTAEVARLRKELQTTNDPAAQARLQAALRQTQNELKIARGEFSVLSRSQADANEKAQLLAQTFGLRLPGEMTKVISRSQAVQTALSAAFSVSIVAAFGAAIVALFPKIADLIDRLRGVGEVSDEVFSKVAELNRALGGFGRPETLEALSREFATVQGRIRELEGQLQGLLPAAGELDRVQGAILRKLAGTGDQAKAVQQELARLRQRSEELVSAIEKARAAKFAEELKNQAAAAAAARVEVEKFNRALEVTLINPLERLAEQRAQIDRSASQVEAAIRAQFEESNRKIREQNESLERGKQVWDELGRQAEVSADRQRAAFERTASDIESFIQRVFLTARSFADVWRQFLMQLVGSFVSAISRMLAATLLGMRSATPGGGGLLGTIFGGIFGRGAAAGAAGASAIATPPFNPASAIPTIGGLTVLPIGGLTPSAAGGATQGLGGALSFGGAGLTGLLPLGLGLGGLLAISRAFTGGRGPGAGAAFGALGGAAIGTAIGTAFFGSLSMGLFALGPVGAAIGAVIGLIAGIFGRGRAKRRAAAIENEIVARARQVVEDFERFRLNAEMALSMLDALQLEALERTRPLGKPGRNAMTTISSVIADSARRIRALERDREARTKLFAFSAVPEFQVGGLVGGRSGLRGGDGILAVLHPGEFVMRRSAVEMLGSDFLNALNRAPRFQDGGPVARRAGPRLPDRPIQIGPIIIQGGSLTPEEIANAVIRKINRRAMDRGLAPIV